MRLIERGKFACGECEDFMRSDGATCGYMAFCRLAILKRKPAAPLTLLVAPRFRAEQVKVQVQRSGKMNTS